MSVRIVAQYRDEEVLLLDTASTIAPGDLHSINLGLGKAEVLKQRDGWYLYLGPWSMDHKLPFAKDNLGSFNWFLFGVFLGTVAGFASSHFGV